MKNLHAWYISITFVKAFRYKQRHPMRSKCELLACTALLCNAYYPMRTHSPSKLALAEQLRAAGLKATTQRRAVLDTLAASKTPRTAASLLTELGSIADQATLYRCLESFVSAGIVAQIDFRHGHAHYELVRNHHHHIVCSSCGIIEDVDECVLDTHMHALAKRSKLFTSPLDHSLEFFGTCTQCKR